MGTDNAGVVRSLPGVALPSDPLPKRRDRGFPRFPPEQVVLVDQRLMTYNHVVCGDGTAGGRRLVDAGDLLRLGHAQTADLSRNCSDPEL